MYLNVGTLLSKFTFYALYSHFCIFKGPTHKQNWNQEVIIALVCDYSDKT